MQGQNLAQTLLFSFQKAAAFFKAISNCSVFSLGNMNYSYHGQIKTKKCNNKQVTQ